MMRIYLLMAGGDVETAKLLELKAKVRSAIRAMGGVEVEVRYKRRWYLVRASAGGGVSVLYRSDNALVEDNERVADILGKLTADVDPSAPVPTKVSRGRRRSSKFEVD